MKRLLCLMAFFPFWLVSCLSLSGDLTVYSARSYMLDLDYSVKNEFAGMKYLADNSSVLVLPLTLEEWREFARLHEGVTFQDASFQRSEGRDRTEIRSRILFEDPAVLETLLSCRAVLEEGPPNRLTLTFDRGSGEPSEEAVTYINGYCAGEEVDFTMSGPANVNSSGSWSLRELLLESEAPSLTLEWED